MDKIDPSDLISSGQNVTVRALQICFALTLCDVIQRSAVCRSHSHASCVYGGPFAVTRRPQCSAALIGAEKLSMMWRHPKAVGVTCSGKLSGIVHIQMALHMNTAYGTCG